jgi:hypothetical protein
MRGRIVYDRYYQQRQGEKMTKDTELQRTMDTTKYYRAEYKDLIGKKIQDVRSMFPEEMRDMGWDDRQPGAVFTLEGGVLFIPMRDEEGNGPGALMVDAGTPAPTARQVMFGD